jgi:hypothetical protein
MDVRRSDVARSPGTHSPMRTASHPHQPPAPDRSCSTQLDQLARLIGGPVVGDHDVEVGAGLEFE